MLYFGLSSTSRKVKADFGGKKELLGRIDAPQKLFSFCAARVVVGFECHYCVPIHLDRDHMQSASSQTFFNE